MTPERPRRRPTRAERRESKHATRRLRRFRAGEVERLRSDALRFTLSEAVVMASLRREAAAIAGDRSGRLHMHRGHLTAVNGGGWAWFVDGDSITAFKENL